MCLVSEEVGFLFLPSQVAGPGTGLSSHLFE